MDEDFMFRLREAMIERSISASELSRLSGVGKSDIHYYLKGRYVPKQDKCYALAKALDVDPGWLMTGYGTKSPARQIRSIADGEEELDDVPQTEEARILAKGIDKLPQEQREQALSVIKAMFAKYSNYFEKENDDEP